MNLKNSVLKILDTVATPFQYELERETIKLVSNQNLKYRDFVQNKDKFRYRNDNLLGLYAMDAQYILDPRQRAILLQPETKQYIAEKQYEIYDAFQRLKYGPAF